MLFSPAKTLLVTEKEIHFTERKQKISKLLKFKYLY